MKLIHYLAMLPLVMAPFLLTSENFTVQSQQKKKLPSCATSKEECAQTGGDILIEIPNMLESLAHLQRQIMRMENELLEGGKQNFFGKASKEQLCDYHQLLKSINDELVNARFAFTTHLKQLEQLQKKALS